MENFENRVSLDTAETRAKSAAREDLAQKAIEMRDSEIAHDILILHYGQELNPNYAYDLVQIIAEDESDRHNELVFQTLRDQPNLEETLKDSLIESVIRTGDKTSCNLLLQILEENDRTHWKSRLEQVLES